MIPGGGSDSPSAHQHDALWQTLAQAAHIVLSPEQLASLHRYLDLLLEANASMNLTRIVDRSAAEVQHIGDALTLLPFLSTGPIQIADVGSGGGVPGIVLAIARPDATVCLIESTQKKARFLQIATVELKLSNVEVLSERAEAVGRPGPYAPTEKQVAFYQRLAASPVFSEEERQRALDWLGTKATRQTIKDQIDWLKRQVETRKPRTSGESAA